MDFSPSPHPIAAVLGEASVSFLLLSLLAVPLGCILAGITQGHPLPHAFEILSRLFVAIRVACSALFSAVAPLAAATRNNRWLR